MLSLEALSLLLPYSCIPGIALSKLINLKKSRDC